jgi:hypothetical protein
MCSIKRRNHHPHHNVHCHYHHRMMIKKEHRLHTTTTLTISSLNKPQLLRRLYFLPTRMVQKARTWKQIHRNQRCTTHGTLPEVWHTPFKVQLHQTPTTVFRLKVKKEEAWTQR